jgi:hypothetical protein
MPHRAGHFVLAYAWDHHCQRLYDALQDKFRRVEQELLQLETGPADGSDSLLGYYLQWQSSSELHRLTMSEVRARQLVINSLGYRGYGVNKDLLAALGSLAGTYRVQGRVLEERFRAHADALRKATGLTRKEMDPQKSREILIRLRKKLGQSADEGVPIRGTEKSLDLAYYWEAMSQETPFHVNNAIFQKMFLSAARSSTTIMKGSTGLHNGRPPTDLKLIANRNFAETGRRLFASLSDYVEINVDLLKSLHCSLMRGHDPLAGSFREIDFPDRNGVTFEYDNFQREVADLSIVLEETARSFPDRERFLHNLARSYYMFNGIHPFWDGNGRVGRCFLNLLLVKKGLPPVAFEDDDEMLALPRYGGSMEDMHAYLREGLRRAVDRYFYERWKLESFGLFGKRVHNISFDSGMHFRQIDDRPRRLEVQFEAFVAEREDIGRTLRDYSKIAFPDSRLLHEMTIYCGFCDAPSTEWHHRLSLRNNFYVKELQPLIEGTRVFDIDFFVEIPYPVRDGDFFACSVASDEGSLLFDNKGLNYMHRLER